LAVDLARSCVIGERPKEMNVEKVKTAEELVNVLEPARAAGLRIVFANGCFDLLHGGHVSYLEDAKSKGDLLVVGLNSDASMHKIKGPNRPVIPEAQRAEILAALDMVDYIVLFDDPTCERLLRTLRPHVHAKGTDYTRETVPERDVAHEVGIEIYIAGDPKENSTKDLIQLILERYGPNNP
jgi:rfaE bifunctional protein nucleotidyltransferase chain/domain